MLGGRGSGLYTNHFSLQWKKERHRLGFHLSRRRHQHSLRHLWTWFDGSLPPLLAALADGGSGDLGLAFGAAVRFLNLEIGQLTVTFWWLYPPPRPPCRRRSCRWREDGGDLSGRYFHGVVNLVRSMCLSMFGAKYWISGRAEWRWILLWDTGP
jgi:hypothetical protein